MEKVKDLAIVLRSVQYEDRHRIVTALSWGSGLVSALARNSILSRRFGGSLDLFVASDWVFSSRPGAELVQLLEAEVREPFEPIRKDLTKLALASVLTEVALRILPPREPCQDFFRLHSNALVGVVELESETGQVLAFLNAYLVKVLQWTGNQPQLDSCLGCACRLEELENGAQVYGELSSAAWICQRCVQAGGGEVLAGRTLWRPETGRDREHGSEKEAFVGLPSTALWELGQSMRVPIREWLRESAEAERRKENKKEKKKEEREQLLLLSFIEDLLAYHLPGLGNERVKSIGYLLGLTHSPQST